MRDSELPFAVPSNRVLRDLTNRLAELGFSSFDPTLAELLGTAPTPGLIGIQFWYASELAPEHPLDALVRLFVLGHAVPLARVREVLSQPICDELLASGLLGARGDLCRSEIRLCPWYGVLVASDRADLQMREDWVIGPDESTALMTQWLLSELASEPASLLDVGTGSGVLVLLAAARGVAALGVDVNSRAIQLARLSASLNELESLARFEVGDARTLALPNAEFDLVTFNAPGIYDVAETGSVAISASGHADGLLRAFYRALPHVLSPKGRAILRHEARTNPPGHFDDLLREAGGGLDVIWNTSGRHLSGLRGLETGFAIVEPSEARALTRVPWWPGQLPFQVTEHLASLEKLEHTPLARLHPELYEYVSVTQTLHPKRAELTVGCSHQYELVPVAHAATLERCDGSRTVEQIATETGLADTAAVVEHLARAALLRLS